MSLLQNSNAVTPVSGYNIDNSARFNNPGSGDGSPGTSRLTKTFGTPTNNKVWTVSLWAKRGQLSVGGTSSKRFFGAKPTSGATAFHCGFEEDNNLVFRYFDTTDTQYRLKSTAVYRDVAAWYHCVFQFNSPHVTSTERMKMWVNGVQVTDFSASAYPPQNNLPGWNESGFIAAVGIVIGNANTPTYEYGWDGLMAEVHFVDGQALTPASFAETDEDTNEWKAIEYDGTHGDNGFYFEFKNSANFGVDSSANASNWTATSMGVEAQMIDTPQNSTGGNFATINPLWSIAGGYNYTLSEGNLVNTVTTGGQTIPSTFMAPPLDQKWYWEWYGVSGGASKGIGVILNMEAATSYENQSAYQWKWEGSNGIMYNTGGSGSYTTANGTLIATGDIAAIFIDGADIKFYKNGTLIYTATDAITVANSNCIIPSGGGYHDNNVYAMNFGQDSSFAGNVTAQGNTDANGNGDFYYTPPTGALACCSANLSEPLIALPGENFNTVLYTGNGGTSTDAITGVGFQTDLNWIKKRSASADHYLTNSVTGLSKGLSSNTTAATDDIQRITSFDSDGFTLPATLYSYVNTSGATYVAWNWKAGGAPTADNVAGAGNVPTAGSVKINGSNSGAALAGTIPATKLSASTTLGFSIVQYEGTGAVATVAHGLSQAPELILFKNIDSAVFWPVYNKTVDPTDYLVLDTNAASADSADYFNDTDPTASVFSLGDKSNLNANTCIAYCFHSVEGYSKVMTWRGNSNTNGIFIYTGFRPAFMMGKCINNTESYFMVDNKRDAYNYEYKRLFADTNVGDSTGDPDILDFVSNGIKMRNSGNSGNINGRNYMGIAFAESPFKTSRAR